MTLQLVAESGPAAKLVLLELEHDAATVLSSLTGPKLVPVIVTVAPPLVGSVVSPPRAMLTRFGAAYVVTRPASTPLLLVVVCCPPTVTSHLNDDPTPAMVVQSIRVCEATVHADESRLYVDWPSVLVRPVSVVTYSALTTLFRPSAAGPKFVPRIVTTVDPAVAIVSVSPSRPELESIFRFVMVGTPYAMVAVDLALSWSPTVTVHW